MICHMSESLAAWVDEVWVVSSASLSLPELSAEVIVDREAHRGPLAGIREGLAAMTAQRAFVMPPIHLSCPRVSSRGCSPREMPLLP